MYLSRLILNPRSRRVRRELAAPYEMHRTIMRAFPDKRNGGPGRVLFRVDSPRDSTKPILLVQSEKKPDWSNLDHVSDYVTHGCNREPPIHTKPLRLTLAPGQRLAFRLRANPTVKRNGKRLGLLTEDQQLAWLARKASDGGFRILSARAIAEGIVSDTKSSASGTHRLTFYAVRYEGILQVLDPEKLLETMRTGIGPAKGLGFGLLSIAPP